MKKLLPSPKARQSAIQTVLQASKGSKPNLNIKYKVATKASSKTGLLRGIK